VARMPKRAKIAEVFDALLLDTFSIFFRSFHALPRMTTSRGVPTSARYGFAALVLKLLREHRPRGVSFAVDAPARTFRTERYADYKAGRARTPSELVQELERLPELLEAFGFPRFCVPGFEADDLLATLAARLGAAGDRPVIVSGDRDLLQLADANTRVLFVGRRGEDATLYDAAAVEARFGVPPALLPTYMALVGDNSDNLVGVPGIGPSTAKSLVLEHRNVATLLARLDQVSSPKLRESLSTSAERLMMNEELARLRSDVPISETTLAAPFTVASVSRLKRLFEELEFKSLLSRLERLEPAPV
jgi:DNA polymerase-1